MIATKLLRKHMPGAEREHEIDTLIENLKSNLFYHGHPINREEAKADLKLKVEHAAAELEPLLWSLYEEFASELQITERFIPAHEWELRQLPVGPAPAPPTTQQILAQMQQLAASGVALGTPGLTEQQIVNLAVAMLPHVSGAAQSGPAKKVRVANLKGAYLQALDGSHVFLTDLTFERATANTATGPQEVMKQEVLWQRWEAET
jgi:hypothetical protein